jgi:hypothetical protein
MIHKEDKPPPPGAKKYPNTVHKAEINNEETFKVPPGYQCVVMRGTVRLLNK